MSKKKKILVYGISGMVGSRIDDLLKSKFHIVGPSHSVLDLTNERLVTKNIAGSNPDQIIYAAGITRVDYAQTHPKEAFKINAEVLEYICATADDLNIPVYYISTEAVFDGTKTRPYKETDSPNPISVYGKSKFEGENIVLSSSRNCVLRTVTVYSATFHRRVDFVRAALNVLKNNDILPDRRGSGFPRSGSDDVFSSASSPTIEGRGIRVFKNKKFAGIVDQFANPTFVDDLVWAIAALLRKGACGIYHLAAVDCCSNYEFVRKIAKTFGYKSSLISKITFDDFSKGKVAPRVKYGCLDTSKFKKEFGGSILHTIDQSLMLFKERVRGYF